MIYLYNRIGEMVDGKYYKCPSRRKEIVDTWKRMYSVAHVNCFLQIAPVVNSFLVDKKGLNKKFRYDRPYSETPHSKGKDYTPQAALIAKGRRRISKDVHSEHNKSSH